GRRRCRDASLRPSLIVWFVASADTRCVARSLYSNRGAKCAREAREALGDQPAIRLADLLECIEHRGGVQAVLLELTDGVAREDLHIELAAYLGLEPLEDRLAEAVRRLPRIPAALENSALGDLLIGAIDVDELARRAGRSPDEMTEALAEFHLDQLLPA